MTSILAFLFVLGVLVFVHELGHFLVARWHGVRVLTFSLGFGPKLLSWRRGDTEYCVSVIPLGGYVKMAGEMGGDGTADFSVTLENKPDEFMSKTKWQRFQIFLAGPLMNILFAVVVLTFVLWQGATEPVYRTQPAKVGSILAKSAAEKAGIKPGDIILRVADRPIATWDQLDMAMMPKAGREVEVVIERAGSLQTLRVTPDSRTRFEIGDIGVVPEFHPQVMVVNPGETAEKAGFKVNDVIFAVNGSPVQYEELLNAIHSNADKPLVFSVGRDGQRFELTATPVKKGKDGMIGVTLAPAEQRRIEPGFFQAARMSAQQNLEWSTLIFQTFAGLFKGEASPKQLMGPVGIAQLSGTAAAISWTALFSMMCMLSLNLGILNLLPVPMLDGGHIFIMALEGAARRDFSLRVKEKLLMAGFVVIMVLMVTVIYNDLTRIEWIEKLMPWR